MLETIGIYDKSFHVLVKCRININLRNRKRVLQNTRAHNKSD